MKDPNPENIVGQKRVSHSIEWRVNVGYALIGLAALYAGWHLFGGLSSTSVDGEDIEIEPVGENDMNGPLLGGGD